MSDYQRRRVYQAEARVAGARLPLPTLDHVKALVWLIEELPVFPEEKRGLMVEVTLDASKAYYTGGTVHLPSRDVGGGWAWNDLTVIHEVAHHLVSDLGWHGPDFPGWTLSILRGLGRVEVAEELAAAYADKGVDINYRAGRIAA